LFSSSTVTESAVFAKEKSKEGDADVDVDADKAAEEEEDDDADRCSVYTSSSDSNDSNNSDEARQCLVCHTDCDDPGCAYVCCRCDGMVHVLCAHASAIAEEEWVLRVGGSFWEGAIGAEICRCR
jgi:hypothetical protein